MCLAGVTLKVIAKTAKISAVDISHTTSRGMYVINPTIGYRLAVHSTCACNELIALHNRHLIDRSYIAYDDAYFRSNFKLASKHWINNGLVRSTYADIISSYSGGKKKIYKAARAHLALEGLVEKDFHIKMFVKQDKYQEASITSKMPRAIQARSAKYNLVLATYLRPYEKWFYMVPGLGPSGTRVVTKGMNSEQIASLLLEKYSYFNNPILLACDHSKFDSTIRAEHLFAEHKIYYVSYKSKYLRYLLNKQINNRGYSRNGIKYNVRGTRMSGDYNTGLGNSLINRAVLESWVHNIKHEILLDGDDSIIIIERDDMKKLDRSHFTRMGFETTIEVFDDITQVDYCQSKLVMSDVPIMCRNPCRALSNMAVCLHRYHPRMYREWMSSVFQCLIHTNSGMPIFDSLTHLVGKFRVVDEDYHRKMEGVNYVRRRICRDAFAKTWGISPEWQRYIEDTISFYFGYKEITNKIQRKIEKYNKYIALQTLHKDNNVSTIVNQFTKHKQSIASRFHSLPTDAYEFWYQFGQTNPEPGAQFAHGSKEVHNSCTSEQLASRCSKEKEVSQIAHLSSST